jgi:dihydropteroate synthase
VNATPDSFSDGGRYERAEDAVRHGLALAAEGAAVVDVGGESTRPGARPVPPEEEARRVVPVVRSLVAAGIAVPVSVDTRNAEVAAAALDAGASIVNDISAGTHDPAMLPLVARRGAGIVLMHMRGTPETMARETAYGDVVSEVLAWLLDRAAVAEAEGIPRGRIRIDPGIGFGKDLEGNLALLRSLERFVATGRPVLVGASRKSFLGALTGRATGDRLAGSLAAVARAREAGVAAVRVHDVAATCDLLRVLAAVGPSGPRPPGV